MQFISVLAWIAVAVLAGLGKFSFWWFLIPTFLAGAFGLANGPHYAGVIEANRRGNLWLFPTQLIIHWFGNILLAKLVFLLTRWIASWESVFREGAYEE